MDDERRADIAGRLHAAAIHLLRRVGEEDVRMGLTRARRSALSVLVFGGERTIGQLAAAEQVTPPTMTRLVSALEADGYVLRVPSPADARVVIVRPTPLAVRVLEEGRARRVARILALLGEAGDGDWARLEDAVAVLERAFTARR